MSLGQVQFPKVATVHERTVQEAQQHADRYARSSRRGQDRRPRAGQVQTIRTDEDVMAEALKLAGGDARRLQVNRDGSVYVR